jgi:predicted TIM-barrel fold metal-dependent hydrolase
MGTKAAVEGYLKLPFKNDEVREKVMYKNAAKLLGLAV